MRLWVFFRCLPRGLLKAWKTDCEVFSNCEKSLASRKYADIVILQITNDESVNSSLKLCLFYNVKLFALKQTVEKADVADLIFTILFLMRVLGQ